MAKIQVKWRDMLKVIQFGTWRPFKPKDGIIDLCEVEYILDDGSVLDFGEDEDESEHKASEPSLKADRKEVNE